MKEYLLLLAIAMVVVVGIVAIAIVASRSSQFHMQCYSGGTLIFDKTVEEGIFGYSLDGQRIYLPDNCIRTRVK